MSAYFTDNSQLDGDARMYLDEGDVVSAMLDSSFPSQNYQPQNQVHQYTGQTPQQNSGLQIEQYAQQQYQKNPQNFHPPQVPIPTGVDPSVNRNDPIIKQEKQSPQFHVPVARAPVAAQKKPAENFAHDVRLLVGLLNLPFFFSKSITYKFLEFQKNHVLRHK